MFFVENLLIPIHFLFTELKNSSFEVTKLQILSLRRTFPSTIQT